MSDLEKIEGHKHDLFTKLVLWSGHKDWFVTYERGMFHATSKFKCKLQPQATYEDAYREWLQAIKDHYGL